MCRALPSFPSAEDAGQSGDIPVLHKTKKDQTKENIHTL